MDLPTAARPRGPKLTLEDAYRSRQTEGRELHGEPLLQRRRLALEQRRLRVGHLHLGRGARLELRAHELLVLPRVDECVVGFFTQGPGRLEIELSASQVVLDARLLRARLQ